MSVSNGGTERLDALVRLPASEWLTGPRILTIVQQKKLIDLAVAAEDIFLGFERRTEQEMDWLEAMRALTSEVVHGHSNRGRG